MHVVAEGHVKEYLAAMGMPHLREVDVPTEEVDRHLAEIVSQHPEENSDQQFARAVARAAWKKYGPPPKEAPTQDQPPSEVPQDLRLALAEIFPSKKAIIRWAIAVLLLLLFLCGKAAFGQIDGIQVQNSIGGVVKHWGGGVSKFKCNANLTCTFGSGVLTIDAGAGGAVAWSGITAPTAGLGLAHAAWPTIFTWNATTGAGVSLFRGTDTASNTGTGYLFDWGTAALSAAKPFRICYRGTTDCITYDTTNLGAVGSATLTANALASNSIAALTNFLGTLCGTNQILEDQGAAWGCIATPSGSAHNLLSATHSDTTVTAAVRGSIIYANLTPAWTALGVQTAGKYPRWDGTDLIASTLAAAGVGTCTNQFVRALNADAAPTCATVAATDADTTITKNSAANTGAAAMTLDMAASTSADAMRIPNIAGGTPTLVGAIVNDTTQKTNKIFSNGISGAPPRVLKMTNCTTEGNCATQADTGGTGGNIDTASGTAGTSTLIFASKLALPANFFIANKAVEVCGVFDFVSSSSPPTLVLSIQVGSTAVLANTAMAPTVSLTNKGATRCAIIQGTAAAGASTSLEAGYTSGSPIPTVTINQFNAVAQPVAGFATNGALTVQFSALWGANTAGNSIALRQFWVKELN